MHKCEDRKCKISQAPMDMFLKKKIIIANIEKNMNSSFIFMLISHLHVTWFTQMIKRKPFTIVDIWEKRQAVMYLMHSLGKFMQLS